MCVGVAGVPGAHTDVAQVNGLRNFESLLREGLVEYLDVNEEGNSQ